ncbi:MAG: YodC family protein [Hydrogenophaga sp.]|uniref:YodC family protein n=1 Tax=Hydrogenophaga sp. TaxID=1904254 RepID=UPI00345668F2|nr:YodC family protein [Hydrogenophaga sp.]
MAKAAYKVGDVVKLKSGGPDMTVKRIIPSSTQSDSYECQWFAGKGLQNGIFAQESLEPKQP